jgi:CRP-like cAMP-binding protein
MTIQEASYDCVARTPLFAGLPCRVASLIVAAASVRQAAPGTALFHQGDPPDHLLQIGSGLVRMTQVSADGSQTTLRVVGAGALVGCVAAFQQFPYPATATAIADGLILSWRASQFRELMHQHPALADNMLRIVGAHAHDMVARVVEMSGKRLEQRIAGALMRLADQAGIAGEGRIALGFPVMRDDLAAMAGVTYFTLSRMLSQWQREGLVSNGRQRLTILAPAQLTRLAAGEV